MKKTIILLVSLLAFVPLGGKTDPGDVIPVEIIKETDPLEIPRSTTPEVECYYFASSSLIKVQFNANLGDATISVTNPSGSYVYSTWVDTSVMDFAEFAAPTIPDLYTITISAADYCGAGFFCIW